MLSSVAAGTCDTAQLVTTRCSELARHSIITILFGCCRGSISELRSISTIFRSNITVKKSSFSCKLSSCSKAMKALLQPHTQKWRHSYSWNKGPRCSFPPSLPNYLLRLEDGLAKNRWVNVAPWAFCHSNHVLNERDIIPCHGRRDPEGRKELTAHTRQGPDSPLLCTSFLCHCTSVKTCVNQTCDFYQGFSWLVMSQIK